VPGQGTLEEGIKVLKSAAHRRSLDDLLRTVLRLVPEYQPSSLILEQLSIAPGEEMTR
jgi:hypothetical protein